MIENESPRPYVAFAAVDTKHARRLYRTQNLIWVWLGVAAMLAGLAYTLRPHLGPVMTTRSHALDEIRELLFFVGGLLIANGVWWIRRELEAFGHVFFATGAILNAIATLTLPHGGYAIPVVTLLGLAVASALRAYFIVRWIGAAGSVSDAARRQ